MSDDAVRAEMAKMGIPQEAIDRAVLGGTRQPVPRAVQPVASHAPVEPPPSAPTTPPVRPDLVEPRVSTGAERVAKAVGSTKDQVRLDTNPLFGEAHGTASPVLPQNVVASMWDDLLKIPKENDAARLEWVRRATSDKGKTTAGALYHHARNQGVALAGAALLPDEVRQELLRMMGQRSDR